MSSPIFQIPLKDFWATLSKGDLWDIPKHTVANVQENLQGVIKIMMKKFHGTQQVKKNEVF